MLEGWSMKKALLIVDMLNDFVEDGGALKVEGAKEIAPFINDLRVEFKKNGFPVIYICDSHLENDPEFELWPSHCVEGTKGAEIIGELKPDANDYVIKKKSYSGFYGTTLHTLLKILEVDTLYITGVAMNICVHYTVADGVMRGYKIVVPVKCVAGLTKEDEEYMKKQFRDVFKIKLV